MVCAAAGSCLVQGLGQGPETGRRKTARGVIALGWIALGRFALGHASHGVSAVGQLGLGLLFGLGQLATGVVGIEQIGYGQYVLAQIGLGEFVRDQDQRHPEAIEFFKSLWAQWRPR